LNAGDACATRKGLIEPAFGIVLLGAPGTAVLWIFGLAAFLVGGISSLHDLNWYSQLITPRERDLRPRRYGNDWTEHSAIKAPLRTNHSAVAALAPSRAACSSFGKPIVDSTGVVAFGCTACASPDGTERQAGK